MKKLIQTTCLLALTQLSFAATLTGELIETDSGFAVKKNTAEIVPVELPEQYQYILPTTVSSYLQQFEGEMVDGVFKANEIPTTVAGHMKKIGTLTKAGDEYFLDQEKIIFKEGKVLNGHKFDEQSKESFINTKIEVEGSYVEIDGEKIFKINALIPADLFSAKKEGYEPYATLTKIEENPFKFIMSDLQQNENAQAPFPYRYTIFEAEDVNVGDHALLLTLSGRTGDHIGSSAGHFVAGRAIVNEDLSLSGEFYNSYVPNKKEILSANTSLPYYFGQVVGGQNVHRPTYTLVVYGGEKIKEIAKNTRDLVDLQNPKLRTQEGTITPTFNCTTIAMDGLKQSGFKGIHDFWKKKLTDKQLLAYLNPLYYLFDHDGGPANLGVISYALATDPERYIPRNAFQAYVVALSHARYRRKHGIKRIDIVQINQYPSSRPVGGYPYIGVSQAMEAVKFIKDDRTYDDEIAAWLNSLGEVDLGEDEEQENDRNCVRVRTEMSRKRGQRLCRN